MAVSKITQWVGTHSIGSDIIMEIRYDVYADMSDGDRRPYLRINKCIFRSTHDRSGPISGMAPFKLKILINGTGTAYSFNSGSDIKHHAGTLYDEDAGEYADGYYYVKFSSTDNIPIKKNGAEFTLNLTVKTENDQTYTVTEPACAPVSVKITGPSSIYTGRASTYNLSRSLLNDEKKCAEAYLRFGFPSWGNVGSVVDGYSGIYTQARHSCESFSTLTFIPLRSGAPEGEKSDPDSGAGSCIELIYYYFTNDSGFGTEHRASGEHSYYTGLYNAIELCHVEVPVTVISRSKVDDALAPVIESAVHQTGRYHEEYERQIERYGGVAQGECHYNIILTAETGGDPDPSVTPYPPGLYIPRTMKYGDEFYYLNVTDYTNGAPVEYTTQIYGYTAEYNGALLSRAGTGLNVTFTLKDGFGFTTTYTDSITVLPYHRPDMPLYRARRCSPLSAGADTDDVFLYDGVYYTPDDYGEYALVEWTVDISPLNDANSRYLTINGPSGNADGRYSSRIIELQDYLCSGYYVVRAEPDVSYDITFTLGDDFYGSQSGYVAWYKSPSVFVAPLNTALAIFDFKKGGTGVALGKVAEYDNTLDIHRNWMVRMPYNTYIQNYDGNGTEVNLYDWLENTISRIGAITSVRDDVIYDYQTWYHGNSATCIPSGYGTIYNEGWYNVLELIPNNDRTAAIKLANAITITKNHLNIILKPSYCFAGSAWDTETYNAMIYLCSTEPTTIDQTTGRPNGTVVAEKIIHGDLDNLGSDEDGFCIWLYEYEDGLNYSVDVSSFRGQSLWLLITCTQGGTSSGGAYNYRDAAMNVSSIILSDTMI